MKIPDNLDFDRAAGVILIYGTALHALAIAPTEARRNDGGAGRCRRHRPCRIEIGKVLGLRSSPAPQPTRSSNSASSTAQTLFNYAKEDLKEGLKKIGGDKGIDIVFDPVGGDFTEAGARSLGWEGRLLVIGFAPVTIPKSAEPAAAEELRHSRRVLGRASRSAFPEKGRANLEKLDEVGGRRKTLIARAATFPLEKTAEAMAVLAERKAMGKVILHP